MREGIFYSWFWMGEGRLSQKQLQKFKCILKYTVSNRNILMMKNRISGILNYRLVVLGVGQWKLEGQNIFDGLGA